VTAIIRKSTTRTASSPGDAGSAFPYINRELSSLEFQYRVLHEAGDERNPLLERVKFLAIFASNMDEFFQIRVSGLMEQAEAHAAPATPSEKPAAEQLAAIRKRFRELLDEQCAVFDRVCSDLSAAGIHLVDYADVPQHHESLRLRFTDEIYPVLTPRAVDPGHPFPYISTLSLSVAIRMEDPEEKEERFARVKVPAVLPRFIQIEPSKFVLLEQVIAANGADVTIVEIGGTVGDIESLPFLEAIRQFRHEVGRENAIFVHVTLVPWINAAQELKTKPTQHSVKELREIGIQPDLLLCRSEQVLSAEIKEKIALFCDVDIENVISAFDVDSVYAVPLGFAEQGVDERVLRLLHLESGPRKLEQWSAMVHRLRNPVGEVEPFHHAKQVLANVIIDLRPHSREALPCENAASLLYLGAGQNSADMASHPLRIEHHDVRQLRHIRVVQYFAEFVEPTQKHCSFVGLDTTRTHLFILTFWR